MDKEDLALNNLQWVICHETQINPNQLLFRGYLVEDWVICSGKISY